MLYYEMIHSFTVGHETVAKLNTDNKAERTTVRWVTTRVPKGKQGRTTATKLMAQLASEDMVLVRVVCEQSPSDPADLAAGVLERISHMSP